nr:AAA family ATPase [uncultured Desulfuromonas sp.]
MEQQIFENLLLKLASDNVDPSQNLTSAEFEDFCETLALRWAKETISGPFETERRIAEPIDILIRVPIAPLPSIPNAVAAAGTQEKKFFQHFIECKLYGRPLTLNVVGASYLHALKERPTSLVIASNQQLTRGAQDFAYWLFQEEMRNATALYTWNPLFLNKQSAIPSHKQKYQRPITHRATNELCDWTLVETGAFRDTIVARKDNKNKLAHSLRPDSSLRFSVRLSNPVVGRRVENVSLCFDHGEIDEVNIPLDIKGKIDKTITLVGIISRERLPGGHIFPAPSLIISSSSGIDRFTCLEGFPKLKTDEMNLYLPDLREKQTHQIINIWMTVEEQKILIIKGEGGVGKTFLCEQVANRLKKEFGFQTTHSPLEVQTELAFLTEIVWLTFTPEIRAALETSEQGLLKALLQQLADSFEESFSREDASSLAELMLLGKWQGADPQILMQLIAQFIVAHNKPILLIVSNAHRMSDSVASGLRSLLAALEGLGWGQVRLIIEARDTQEDIGDTWRHLESWMNNALSSRMQRVNLKPLTHTSITAEIGSMLVSLDAENATELICKKSGGNPLFIKHLLQALTEQDMLVPSWNHQKDKLQYYLPRLAPLRDYISSLSVKIEDILVRRISFWDQRLRAAGGDWSGYLLGLMSILEQEVSRNILQALTGEPSGKLDASLSGLEEAGLLERIADDTYIFPHEYTRLAARVWLEKQINSRMRMENASINPIDLNSPEAYQLAFCKGQLNAYLRQSEKALEAYNAALQFAGENFEYLFKCHQQIHRTLKDNRSTKTPRIFHENVRSYLSHGYYILTVKKNKKINMQALSALSTNMLSRQERTGYMQQYHHNLSNLSLREIDLEDYLKNAKATLDLSTTPLEVARFLNRALKACSYIGAVGLGARFGSACLSLQKMVSKNDDQDLESVNFGELSFLLSTTAPEKALIFAEYACDTASSERQRAHNLFARALAKLRLGSVDSAIKDIEEMGSIVEHLSLRTLKSPLEMAYGVKALFDEAWVLAADSFRISLSEATWLGSFRDEITAGSNLVVARIFAGDLEAARHINESLLILISNRCKYFDFNFLQPLFHKTNCWLRRHCPSVLDAPPNDLLLHTDMIGPHILTPFLLNAKKLSNTWPEMFPALDFFTIDPKLYAMEGIEMKGVIRLAPASQPELYVIG